MDTGIVVIAVIVVLFYVRLYLIRRGKKRREKLEVIQNIKMGKKGPKIQPRDPNAPAFSVKSWWIVTPGILLMLLGLAIFSQAFLPEYRIYWWVPVAVGGILFIFGFE